ncbi:sensor histidine kinase [Sphingomonas sanguinis]|uniref:histidine kinase n=2 Tax=Sphingomonas sanguinis TaxID=33051 RepID=A0ABU5LKS0_9SPHN|nr:sensor histidine kinase [Sphingomonas sanguinis]QXT37612.1 sensor histidine kinase [Sphingomonas sanguinis]
MVSILTLTGIGGAMALAVMLTLVISPGFAELEERATEGYRVRAETAVSDFAAMTEVMAREQANAVGTVPAVPSYAIVYRRSPGAVATVRGAPGKREVAAALDRLAINRLVGSGRSARFYLKAERDVMAVGLAESPDGLAYVAVARRLTGEHLSRLLGRRVALSAETVSSDMATRRRAQFIDIAVPIAGADGRPVASVRFQVSREVVLLGRRVLLLAAAASILLLVLLLLMLRRALGRFVLAPLDRVERHMQRVQVSGALLPFEDDQSRCEEFRSLGRSFNAMLSQLKDLRERNEIQSFALGRSESAVAVLHNVRNALAPLATILSHGIGQGDKARRDLLDRALDELARGDVDADRRAKLAMFIATAFDTEAMARDEVRRQLEVGRDAMRQTLEIIGAQQARAHERPPRERCDISDIVARNATIARYAQAVSVGFTFPAHPAYVVANRVILSQVIGNLFANAVEAIVATGRGHGSITVDIAAPSDGRLALRIIDDGEGFEPAQATRLFQPGYSTRTEKSGGLGLHWCANSMAVMGGTLELRSAGRGTGAVAILTLDADGEGEQPVDLAA